MMTTNYTRIFNQNLDMFDMETGEQIIEAIKEDVTMKNYTAETLVQMFEAAKWGEIEITCPDGTEISVKPCGYGDVRSLEDVDCFLVYGDLPWMGGMDGKHIQKLVDEINDHAKLVEEAEAERRELREFFDKHEAEGWGSDAWSWYSDWHKDLYGYRPHGHVCGVYVRPW